MALTSIKCTDFRCLESVKLDLLPGNNLIYGANASGKTSLLEAIAYLGRGRSFRGASTHEVIRHGQDCFVLFGCVESGGRNVKLGVRNGQEGLEVHKNGEKRSSAAALAEALPLQLVDPDVHKLVAGGPDDRRRFTDWIAFHVEHGYLEDWRKFKRALRQRNAALKFGTAANSLSGWDQELAELGVKINETRQRVLEGLRAPLEQTGLALLGSAIDFSYYQGWGADKSLPEALAESLQRDQQIGTTHAGPHRADIRLKYDERQARKLVSRGQQKLLACALILAATQMVQDALQRRLLLLLDDPAAELDRDSLARLMSSVKDLGCQVIATTLAADQALFGAKPRLFHVEQGVVTQP